MATKQCEHCGKEYEFKRRTSRFCSDNCRAKAGGNQKAGPSGRLRIPDDVRWSVMRRDNFKCRYCGNHPPRASLRIDHITPISEGGAKLDPNNLLTTCRWCNSGKGDDIIDPFEVPSA